MQVAEVKIWGQLVGAVAWDQDNGLATFEYDPKFKSLGWELAPLKMPVSGNQNQFSFPELRKDKNAAYDTFKGLPGLLADAPTRPIRQPVDQSLAVTTGKATRQHEPH